MASAERVGNLCQTAETFEWLRGRTVSLRYAVATAYDLSDLVLSLLVNCSRPRFGARLAIGILRKDATSFDGIHRGHLFFPEHLANAADIAFHIRGHEIPELFHQSSFREGDLDSRCR